MIVVTGASRGLGRAVSERLVSSGEKVFGLSRTVKNLPFPAVSCDVSNAISVKAAMRLVKATGEQVTGLVNAAGVASMNLALMSPPSQVRSVIEVNLLGTIFCCQAFAPLMVRAKRGRIVNFSSIAVSLGLEGEAVYSASKAGVEAFSRSFAREVSAHGIRVNCIAPGPIDTELIRGVPDEKISKVVARQVVQRQYESSSVCDLVELLLESRAEPISGQTLHVGGA